VDIDAGRAIMFCLHKCHVSELSQRDCASSHVAAHCALHGASWCKLVQAWARAEYNRARGRQDCCCCTRVIEKEAKEAIQVSLHDCFRKDTEHSLDSVRLCIRGGDDARQANRCGKAHYAS
jgi:hypothetical protein